MGTYIKAIKRSEDRGIKKKGITLTISGLSCSGKTTVAECLAKKFKLRLVEAGGAFWRSISKERGIDLDQLSKTAEKEIDLEMDKRTLQAAQKGGAVLTGRLAGWAAGDWADYRIMLTASDEVRAKRSAGRDSLSLAKAKALVKGRDAQDRKRYLRCYGIDVFDFSIYNLVLDTSKLNSKQVCEIVAGIVQKSLS